MTGSVLATAEYGRPDGPPIVALHGAAGPGSREGQERLVTECAPQRRWICPDLRGFGASVKSPPWTLDQHAQDIISTLDSRRVEMADLIGFSLGGAVAFAVVRLAPARVRSVVVLDAAVCTPEHYLSDRNFHDTPELIAALQKSTSENLPPNLGTFVGHVLVLAAGASTRHNVTETGKAALRSQLGPRLHVVTIAEAGHNLLRDAFDETVSEIRQFLNEVDQDRRTSAEAVSVAYSQLPQTEAEVGWADQATRRMIAGESW
jgi:pimeloyl-ACP methyl ester carboxylesterase